jgi:hypothetical protein
MTISELEQRVVALERQVQHLSNELREMTRPKDWRAAVEKYAGDEDLLSVFADSAKLREEGRKRARSRRNTARKPRT